MAHGRARDPKPCARSHGRLDSQFRTTQCISGIMPGKWQMETSVSNVTTGEATETERSKESLDRLVSLGARAFATRIVVASVFALAMLVGGYYFLVDRTLRPLEERVASMEATTNSRMVSLEEGLRTQSASLARIEAKLDGLNDSLGSLENSFGADVQELKAGAAQSILEQRDLALTLARLEAKIEGIQDSSFDPNLPLHLPDWPEVFPTIELEQWSVEVSGDRANPSLVALRTHSILDRAIAYAEPSEQQMLEALLRQIVGADAANRELIIENSLNRISVKISDFEKLECVISRKEVGYSCSYAIRTEVSFFSNEGNEAGERHAEALNTLFNSLRNAQPERSFERRTFSMQDETWIVRQN